MRRLLASSIVLGLAASALADPAPPQLPPPLAGRVLDRATGIPVAGALVEITGPAGTVQVLHTDEAGRYRASVPPGTYRVIFVHRTSRAIGTITVQATGAVLDGKVDANLGEVIVIRDRIAPPTRAKPLDYNPEATPPYSARAILEDAWTKAHLLLDVAEDGTVRRYKFLKRPGHELESIAVQEATKLTFDPARDRAGKPMRAWLVWTIEWPSAGWLQKFLGTRTRMPPTVGFPPRRQDEVVPCLGSNRPLTLSSAHPVYRDCSKPDLRNAVDEPWVDVRRAR